MTQRKKLSPVTKVVMFVSAFLLLVDAALGAFLVTYSIHRTKQMITRKMVEIACTAAELVNGDEIETLTIADKENQTEAYTKNFNILKSFKTSAENTDGDLAYIYCLVKIGDKIVFSLDPSDDPGQFLVEETIYTDALLRCFETGEPDFDRESYVDRWGNLYTAYAPVKASDGHLAAVIGVDIWAKWYEKEIAFNAISIGAISLLTIAFGVTVSVLITNRTRKRLSVVSDEMNSLEEEVRGLLKEISDPRYAQSKTVLNNNGEDNLANLKDKIHTTGTELKQYIQYVHEQAYLDPLTGLGNRASYYEKEKEIEIKSKDAPVSYSLILFDINGLKEINDDFGHDSGDKAINFSARIIKSIFGQPNTFRAGGDEIVVVLENATKEEIDRKLVLFDERLVDFNSTDRNISFKLSISYGYASLSKENNTFELVFRAADRMMFARKKEYYSKLELKD